MYDSCELQRYSLGPHVLRTKNIHCFEKHTALQGSPVLRPKNIHRDLQAVTKSGTGTWDLGREDSGTPGRGTRGRGDVGLGDAGTPGRRDVGLGDAGTWDSWTLGRGTRDAGRGDSKTLRLGDVGRRGLEDVITNNT